MTDLGAVCLPQLPPERFADLARHAEDVGLDELWLWEDCFLGGGIACASAALAWTSRLRVGIGLLPVPLRNVAVAAMEVASLHRLFGDRPIVGVGHGVLDWMGQVGARAESPLTLLREYVTALRALLCGDRLDTEGRYVRLDGVALDWPPQTAPPVLVGATGPRTLRLAGEVGDGTILTASTTADEVRAARAAIDEGRTAGGRDDAHRVVVYLMAATGDGAAERLDAERRAWQLGQRQGVAGDAAAVADAVARYAAAGADTVVLQPTTDDPDPAGFVRFVAEQVRPLVP